MPDNTKNLTRLFSVMLPFLYTYKLHSMILEQELRELKPFSFEKGFGDNVKSANAHLPLYYFSGAITFFTPNIAQCYTLVNKCGDEMHFYREGTFCEQTNLLRMINPSYNLYNI